MSILFSPISLRDLSVKNRLWIAPMCQYSATDGTVSAWHQQWLGSLSSGGHGLVIVEATAVVPEGRISPHDVGLWRDDHVEAWRPIIDFAHEFGCRMAVQLAHAGRKASTKRLWDGGGTLAEGEGGWLPVGPTALAFEGMVVPHELTIDEIDRIVEAFATAARRARTAGFDAIEIHAAHGYLIHEFLSPLSNLRTDEYGGSFENRIRLVRRIYSAIRQAVGEAVPVFTRISATDYVDTGWSLDDSIELSEILTTDGCDLIDCSSGGNVNVRIPDIGPGYQVPFSRAIKSSTNARTGAVGLITSGTQAEEILGANDADVILVARAAMRDPHFAMNAAEELGERIDWAPQLERARRVK